MASLDFQSIAQKMRNLDIATFTTVTGDGALASRPMSNNGDVEYDGNSYYFTYKQSRLVADIGGNPRVNLGFAGSDDLYVAVAGEAELIRDKAQFEAHWVPDLDHWFAQGVDTPGIVLVKVVASRIKYWKGEDQGEWSADSTRSPG
jgi:general stress protein 26